MDNCQMEQSNLYLGKVIQRKYMQELNLLSLEKRREYLSCCQIYKIINNLNCLSVKHVYTPNIHPHTNTPYFVSMLELTVI